MADKEHKTNTALFTPEIDKQIVEGLAEDRKGTLEKLAKVGFTETAVLQRAWKLGLTKDILTQCRLDGVDLSVRRCLKCDRRFVSLGPQNRLCKRCRARE